MFGQSRPSLYNGLQINYNRAMTDLLIIAGRQFRSRLIVGTGKYKSFQETARALEASGADMVTVAVRRVNLDRSKESLLDYIDPKKYFLLPNTAGCYTADDTIRTARAAYARAAASGDKSWMLLAVHETPLIDVIARANKDSKNL